MSIKNKVTGQLPNITTYDPVTGEVIDITVPGDITAAYFIGDGSNLSNIDAGNLVGAYGNANVAAYLPTYSGTITANSANVTGNVLGANFIGNGQYLSNINGANIVGGYGNANVANYLPTNLSNINANNITTLGNLSIGKVGDSRNLQNYTATGTRITFDFTGLAPGIPFAIGETVFVSGTGVTGLDGTYIVTNCYSYAVEVASTFAAGSGPVTFGSSVTSTNLKSASISGNLIAATISSNGTLTVSGISTLATVNASGNISGANFIGNGQYLSNINIANIAGSYSNSNVAFYLPNNTSNISGNVITGNLFSGDGGQLSNIIGSNIIGDINISPNNITAGNATFNGNISVTGNVTVSGNLNYQDVTDLVVGDPIIYIGANNTADIVDLGLVASYDPGAGELHTGLARDHTDGIWKLFTGLSNEPTTVIDWANATLGTLEVGTIIGDGGFLSNINASNLVGAYSNSNVANYLPINTSSVNANVVTAVLFSGDGGQLSNIIAANLVGAYSNANVAAYLPLNTSSVNANVVTATLFSGDGGGLSNIIAANLVGAYSNSNVAAYLPLNTSSVNANVVTANLFSGDGGGLSNIIAANLVGAYSNANVANYLPLNTSSVNANVVTATLFSGDGGQLSNIIAANLVGAYSNADVANYLPLNTSSVNANVVTAALFSGDGGQLSNIIAANLVGAYSNANVADYLANNATSGDIYGGIITGTYLYGDGSNLTNIDGSTIFGDINISPNNITAGNATFNGNISVTGNVTVSGNLNYQDVTDLVVGDPLIYIGANNTADIVDLGLVASYDPGAGQLHTGFVRDHTDGIWKLFTALADEPTTVVNWANATLGTIEVGTIIGDGGFLSNIQYALSLIHI